MTEQRSRRGNKGPGSRGAGAAGATGRSTGRSAHGKPSVARTGEPGNRARGKDKHPSGGGRHASEPDKHPRGNDKRPRAAFQKRPQSSDGIESVEIYGIHAAEAALFNSARQVTRLVATENAASRLAVAIAHRGIEPETVTPKQLDGRLGSDSVHQGVLVQALALPGPTFDDVVESAQTGGPVVVLDQITDPHNVGAILRSAAVFGACALIMTRRNSPALSGALAKSASGAVELVPVHVASNLSRTLGLLQEAGLLVMGLDGESDQLIEEKDLSGPCAIVLGAEGRGLRQLTRERCSMLCRISTAGNLASLNVSNAAAVSLHVVATQRNVR